MWSLEMIVAMNETAEEKAKRKKELESGRRNKPKKTKKIRVA